jgi:flagellar biosynthesis/type III secretory pathway M-ring protein FliF/YscJ
MLLTKFSPILKYVGGVIGGVMVAWIVYVGVVRPHTKPNPTTTNQAETMVNYTFTVQPRFGCSSVRVDEWKRNDNTHNLAK